MGLLSNLKKLFSGDKINLKELPKFSVTEFQELTDYSGLVESNEYLDQYIGWTYRAVSFKAAAAARQELKLYKQTTSRKAEQLTWDKEPILKDLYRFNEIQTLYEARFLLHLYMGLVGIAFIWVNEGVKGGSKDFYLLNPENFDIETNRAGLPLKYIFRTVSGEEIKIDPRDLMILRNPDPKNWLRGKSPVQASMYAINSWEFAMQLNMNTFGNQGKMQGILAFDGIGKSERKRLERTLKQRYQGTKNAGKIMITGTTPSWIPMANNLKDLEYIEGIRLMREEILSVHGVPSVLVNADGKYENTKEAEKIFAKYTIDPLLTMEAEMYTEQLLPRYYGKDSIEAKKMWFEFESAVQTDPKEQAETTKILVEAKVLTLNEARAMNGLEPVANGDEISWDMEEPKVEEPENDQENEEEKQVQNKIIVKEFPEKELLRESFLAKTINNENKFLKRCRKYFNEQSERAIDTLISKNKQLDYEIGLNLVEETAIAINFFQPVYEELGIIFYDQAGELLEEPKPLSSSAQKLLTKNLEYFAKEINQTTINDLNDLLIFAMENGTGLEDTKKAIKELFDRYNNIPDDGQGEKLSRAEMIARTETSNVKNAMSYNRYKASKKVIGYEWLATGGKGARENHTALDGVTIDKDGFFNVSGYKVKRPYDSKLPAKEKINCRCDVLPVIKND